MTPAPPPPMEALREYCRRTGWSTQAVFTVVYPDPFESCAIHQLWYENKCDPIQVEAWCEQQLRNLNQRKLL